ncbi:DNA polymerase III subunit gamma and tau [Dactylosporangium sp. CA-092794]|uniref:DNA polymerase III subunit gamma and tau n=1 Tax=Dactylosporangium sp. CA-092794 TaxID=3239929 RepID=UPI003D91952A
MALALYRKYRPRTFAEVIGQEHVTEPLSQALRSGRLNHAYLFSGPRGCGKTSSARILARSLNCERGPTPEPCGECQSCRDLAPDGAGSIDVIEIDAASHGGVDDARDLRERAFFAPVSSRFKVYVIDEAHMVSSAGFNALLKLVEEPPDYVKFVFATTEPEKVLGTIKSRTHHYPFRLIPPGVLRPYLEQLTAAEGVKVEPAVFPLVVRAGAGSARDSLSVLDQLIAGAGEEGVTYARAVALLGVTDVALIDEMCDALAADDGRGAYGVIDRVVEAGHDPRRFASDLLERLRDLIVLQQVPDAVTKGLLDAPHDELERMGAQATQLGQATLSRFADIVHNGLTEMRGTTAPRLLLELITARMLLPAADDSSAALLQRLERMERRLQAGSVPAPTSPAPSPAPSPADPEVSGAAPVRGSVESGSSRGLDYIREPRGGAPGGQPGGQSQAPEVPDASWSSAPPPGPVADERPAPTPAPAPETRPAPVTHAAPGGQTTGGGPAPAQPPASGGALDADAMRRVWPDVLALVNDKSKKSGAILRDAIVQDVEGGTLVLAFKYSTHANMLNAAPEVLISALQELFGGRWQVRCEVGGQPGGGGGGGGGNRPTPPKPTPQPPGPSAPPSASGPSASGPSASGPPAPSGYHAVPGQPSAPSHYTTAAPSAAAGPSAVVGPSAVAGSSGGAESSAVAGRSVSSAVLSATASPPAGPGQHGPAGLGQPGPAGPGRPDSSGGPGQQVAASQAGSAGGGPGQAAPNGYRGSSSGRPVGAPAQAAPADDDWPTPAIPGGGGAAQVTAPAVVASAPDDDWPMPATPGGAAATAAAHPAPAMQHAAADIGGRPVAGSAPIGSAPIGSAPIGSAPIGSAPIGSAPAGVDAPAGAAAGWAEAALGSANGARIGAGSPNGVSAGSPNGANAGTALHGSNPPGPANGGKPAAAAPVKGGRSRPGGSSALERAREAASRAAAAAANGGRRGAGAVSAPPAAPAESAWEGTGAEEPPFDPEYDQPVQDSRFPGLDPGDELLDDATEVRETSEEAALRLLVEALGAEKIGETTG